MSISFAAYTIGYSGYLNNRDIFIDELKKRKIDVLIDVRSKPYSAQFGQFNKEPFQEELKKNGIIYCNYSEQFGAKQLNHKYYSKFDGVEDRIDYELFTKSDMFLDGVEKLKMLCKMEYLPVIMCAEKDPIKCHRAIMICNALYNYHNFKITHIQPGKPDESHDALEYRLMKTIRSDLAKKKKLNQLEVKMKDELFSLFSSGSAYKDDIQNYYKIMNSRIGWTFDQSQEAGKKLDEEGDQIIGYPFGQSLEYRK